MNHAKIFCTFDRLVISLQRHSGSLIRKWKQFPAQQPTELRLSKVLNVKRTILFGDMDFEQSIAFTDMVFHAAYNFGGADNERNLRVWVTESDPGADETAVYHSILYQLPVNSGPAKPVCGRAWFYRIELQLPA